VWEHVPGDVRRTHPEPGVVNDSGAYRKNLAEDQGGQAGRKDDPPLLSPFSLEPSAAGAEPAGLQPGEFVAAAGVAQANRELVADQPTAAAGENAWKVGETCPLLLAAVGREPSDEAALWEYGAADRCAVASGGIAEAVAGEIDPESRGDGEVSDKTGQEGRGQQLRDSRRGTPIPVPRPGPGQGKHSCAGAPEQVYSVGLLGAKTEIPVYFTSTF
jgi:hypothetical protein